MKKLIFSLAFLLGITHQARAQWAVIDPTNLVQNTMSAIKGAATAANMAKNFQETVKIYQKSKQYYDALKKVHTLVRDARKVQQTILMVGEISDNYVTNFQRMLADPNFSPEELEAIADGYAVLLRETGGVLAEMKAVVNENGLSVDDKGRIDVVERCYDKIYEFRALTRYYTNKNIGVSWLRAKKRGETDRVLSLYGNPTQKYW